MVHTSGFFNETLRRLISFSLRDKAWLLRIERTGPRLLQNAGNPRIIQYMFYPHTADPRYFEVNGNYRKAGITRIANIINKYILSFYVRVR
jgi:hypothetical protein